MSDRIVLAAMALLAVALVALALVWPAGERAAPAAPLKQPPAAVRH
ncbi:MAG TPA: hypothetical protein VIC25_02330 [Caulobacteraceae bacterium]|jgi:hypothetical protein